MLRFTQPDYERLFSFLGRIHACRSEEKFPALAVTELARIIPAHHVIWNHMAPAVPQARTVACPEIPQDERRTALFAEHMREHPVVRHFMATGDPGPRAISDFWSERHFHRTALYGALYRDMGVEDQMGFWLSSRTPEMVGIAFTRPERSFTEADRALLDLVRPHIAQAWRNARAFSRMRRLALARRPAGNRPGLSPASLDGAGPIASPQRLRALGLTLREIAVVVELEKGGTNHEIAAALFISPLTVRKHLENIYAKLGVTSRTAALRAAHAGIAPAISPSASMTAARTSGELCK
jgi:DNA-binding CsgD family transcriptional regulator